MNADTQNQNILRSIQLDILFPDVMIFLVKRIGKKQSKEYKKLDFVANQIQF